MTTAATETDASETAEKATDRPIVYVNGKMLPKSQAAINVFDHVLLYGDGIFEGIQHEDEEWQLLGVQWHPEFLGDNFDEPSHRLFDTIVEHATEYRDR